MCKEERVMDKNRTLDFHDPVASRNYRYNHFKNSTDHRIEFKSDWMITKVIGIIASILIAILLFVKWRNDHEKSEI